MMLPLRRLFLFVFVSVLMLPEIFSAKKFAIDGLSDDVVEDFDKEYGNYVKTGKMTSKLQNVVEALKLKTNKKNECVSCHAVFSFLLKNLRHETQQNLRFLLQDLCLKILELKSHVCAGLVDSHLEMLQFMMTNRPEISSDQVCGLLYQKGDCKLTDPAFDWKINVNNNTQVNKLPEEKERTLLNIIQISDVHYDPKYQVRSNAVCGEPACCRTNQGFPDKPEDGAGKWGDYRGCDTPLIAIEDAFNQVKRQHKKIDLVYFTGDIIDHGNWETSYEANKQSIKLILSLLKEISPTTIVCPVLGNHEPHPLNVYAPDNVRPDLNTQWLYDLITEEFVSMFQNVEVNKTTIKQGGYYTLLAKPGLRIIALNNNVEYVFNWWLLYDPAYPKQQLQWLHDTLLKAEQQNERVHILAHVPPGTSDNFITWDREYRRIVERFSNIITAQFNGHSHKDEFNIFYNTTNSSIPINVAYNGGSVTAFTDRNPNYKLFQVESGTYKVLNHESWIYNLTEANLEPQKNPNWFKMYSFKEDFALKSLEPVELDKLVKRMAKDDKLAYKYFQFKVKQADTALAKGCDKDCLKKHLCDIVTTVPDDNRTCNALLGIKYNFTNKLKDILTYIWNFWSSILKGLLTISHVAESRHPKM